MAAPGQATEFARLREQRITSGQFQGMSFGEVVDVVSDPWKVLKSLKG